MSYPPADQKVGFDALRKAAPLALALSEKHCTDHCRCYHGAWGFLRLYDVRRSVFQDHEFLLDTLEKAARKGLRRVLISGAADFGILSYILEAFASAGVKPYITVVDKCQTPLEINLWYARRMGAEVTVIKSDIHDLDGGIFDLVVAHNFLNFFNSRQRRDLVAKWVQSLSPEGRIISISRLRPEEPEQSRRFVNQGVELLVEKVREAHQGSADRALIDADRLEGLVRGYAAQRLPWNIRSESELEDPFEHAGLLYCMTSTDAELPGGDHSLPRIRIGVVACNYRKNTFAHS